MLINKICIQVAELGIGCVLYSLLSILLPLAGKPVERALSIADHLHEAVLLQHLALSSPLIISWLFYTLHWFQGAILTLPVDIIEPILHISSKSFSCCCIVHLHIAWAGRVALCYDDFSEKSKKQRWARLVHVSQSCPRVTFLGPDSTRRNVDPTRLAIADKKSDPTRPGLYYYYYYYYYYY